MSIRFRGTPRLVEGLASLTQQQALTASLSLDLKLPRAAQPAAPLMLQTSPVSSSATRLRFSLPESTPPGTYEGMAQIGGESYPIIVEVEPHPDLVITPRQLSLQAAPGTEAIVDLTLVNSGNIPHEIPKADAFSLFDVEGTERSIGIMLGDPAEKALGRLTRLIDEVADNHGGQVQVNVREGHGMLESGELRNLRVILHFSDLLKPGHTYWGTWPLLNLTYFVRVYATSPYPAPTGEATTQKESS